MSRCGRRFGVGGAGNAKPKFAVRAYTRCGRPHTVYRKLGLCRVCGGELPGVRKSSW
ncbi:hypothetical protein [Nocardia sp. NPDC047038]|uniref:hypothetical protein n=1 Tax=Nocardia sp. NPDC047038 TaxID=3154338 RepID=UPI0033D5EEBD